MERKKASDFPQGLLDLFDEYVHGGISRRDFIDGAQKYAVGGITATALLEMMKPNYAFAAQVPANDPATMLSLKCSPTGTTHTQSLRSFRIGCHLFRSRC